MATRKIICEFNPVNGSKTGVFARTGQSKASPSRGILYMKNCPDGKTFVVEADGGRNGFHKVLHPSYYGLPNTTLYVWIDDSYIRRKTYTTEDVPRPPGRYDSSSSNNIVDQPRGKKPSEEILDYVPPKGEFTPDGIGTFNFSKNNDRVWGKGQLTPQDVKEINLAGEQGGAIIFEPPNKYSYGSIVRNSFYNDYSYLKDALDVVEKNMNLALGAPSLKNLKYDMHNRFNRYRLNYADNQLAKTVQYIFFTRPDLNILQPTGGNNYLLTKGIAKSPEFYYLHNNKPEILLGLTRHLSSYHDFNPFLSNNARSFQLKDEVVETTDHGETYTGHKITYGRHKNRSKVGGEFSIDFIEDDEFTVYKMMTAWTNYIDGVYKGLFDPEMIRLINKEIDYACSVYYFTCAVDGSTILFWTKYTGVFPTNTPSSTLSYTDGSDVRLPKYSINFNYAWKDDFSLLSLGEFNANSRGNLKYAASYDPVTLTGGRAFVGAPFVETVRNNAGEYSLKLRFRVPE